MIRRTLPPPAFPVLALLGLAACDSQSTIAVVPEFEQSFDFESGLQGWTAGSGGLAPGTFVEVEPVTGPAAAGQGSVRIAAASEEAGGRIWIARDFEVTPEQAYEVTLSFSLGTADDGSVAPWEVVAGTGTATPTAGQLAALGTTEPETSDGTFVWEARTRTFVLVSGAADPGEETTTVWIALGIGIPVADDREYGFDEVEVSFLRN